MSASDDRDDRRVGDATRQRIEGLADGWNIPKKKEDPARSKVAKESEPDSSADRGATEKDEAPKRAARGESEPVLRAGSVPLGSASASRRPATEDASGLIIGVERADDAAEDAEEEPEAREEPSRGAGRLLTERVVEAEEVDEGEDPTALQQLDDEPRRPAAPGTHLRRPAALPRKRGLLGDVKYVFTAFFGVAGARRELAAVEKKISVERASRRDRLTHIAKHALADDSIELRAVAIAREKATRIEEIRSRHAGATAAADAKIERLERNRLDDSETIAAEISDLEAELKEIAERLAPLERTSNAAVKRAADLQVTLAALDEKIVNLEASAAGGKGGRSQRVGARGSPEAQQAALAAARAERAAVLDEEPEIAAELDDLNPRIANLNAAREDAEKKLAEARERDRDGTVRTDERVAAVRARKAVDERAVADADRALDEVLVALGEKLAMERPRQLGSRLRPVDEHDVSIATLERRALELGELVGGVNRAAIARGILVIAVFVGAVAAGVWYGRDYF